MAAYKRKSKRATGKRESGKSKQSRKKTVKSKTERENEQKPKLTRKPKAKAKATARAKPRKAKPRAGRKAASKKSTGKKTAGRKATPKKKTAAATKTEAKKRSRQKAPAKATKPVKKAKKPTKAKPKAPKKSAQVKAREAKARAREAERKAAEAEAKRVAAAKKRAAKRRKNEAARKRLERMEKLRQSANRAGNRGREAADIRAKVRRRKKEIEKSRGQRIPTVFSEAGKSIQGRFRELFRKAKKTGQLPAKANRRRIIRNEKAVGEQRHITLNRELHEGAIEAIMYRVRNAVAKMPKTFPLWLSVMVFSSMGERLIGYGSKVLKAEDDDADLFQTEGYDSSGVWPTHQGMLESLETKLEDYASEDFTVVFIHHIRISTFRRVG